MYIPGQGIRPYLSALETLTGHNKALYKFIFFTFYFIQNYKPDQEKVSRHFVPKHFRPKTFQHHQTGTGTELSRPPANIFATVGYTEEVLVIIIKEDHWFYSSTQEYTAED